MDLIRQRLASAHGPGPAEVNPPKRLTVKEAIRYLRQPPIQVAATDGHLRGPNSQTGIVAAWFNPWAHQSGEQIWAGLAHAIMEAVRPVLYPSEPERERYWFARNLARVDRHSLRRALRLRVVSPLLGAALLAVALPLTISLVEFGKILWILGYRINAAIAALLLPIAFLIAGSLHTLTRYCWGWAVNYLPTEIFYGPGIGQKAISASDISILADPLRQATRGSLYLHQHDVRVILSDIADAGYHLAVFVDDLDRCSAATTAEVFEAINLFLSGLNSSGLSARFVIGIDPEVIAAHLDQVYSGLNLPQVGRQADDPSVGWAYLRKLVQLPVAVPRVSDQALTNFVDSEENPSRKLFEPVLSLSWQRSWCAGHVSRMVCVAVMVSKGVFSYLPQQPRMMSPGNMHLARFPLTLPTTARHWRTCAPCCANTTAQRLPTWRVS